jgi:hypothetical protein
MASMKRGPRVVRIVLRPTVALRCHIRSAPRGEKAYAASARSSGARARVDG